MSLIAVIRLDDNVKAVTYCSLNVKLGIEENKLDDRSRKFNFAGKVAAFVLLNMLLANSSMSTLIKNPKSGIDVSRFPWKSTSVNELAKGSNVLLKYVELDSRFPPRDKEINELDVGSHVMSDITLSSMPNVCKVVTRESALGTIDSLLLSNDRLVKPFNMSKASSGMEDTRLPSKLS